MKFTSFTLIIAAILFITNRAFAEAIGEVGIHLASDRMEDTSGASPSSANERHFRLNLASGWKSNLNDEHALGYGLSLKNERGLQSGSDLSGYGLGLFLGWYFGAISMRFDFIFMAEQKSNSGIVESQFSNGSGMSLEVRWLHWMDKIAFGPSLVLDRMKYRRARIGSLPETDSERTTESFTPGLTGVFIF
jgi:hypothetical protein